MVVKAEDHIAICAPLPKNPADRDFVSTGLQLLYDDHQVLVCNKPPGQLAHQAGRVLSGTLLNELQALAIERGLPQESMRLVNRIDRDTSGLVLASTDADRHRLLCESLQDHQFQKIYLAICHGVPDQQHGHWTASIRDTPGGKTIARECHPEGQNSHTEYRIREVSDDQQFSLLELTLHTGRQHQIRVHASYHGHPLVGDWVYGAPCEELSGQALHAHRLTIPDPAQVVLDPAVATSNLAEGQQTPTITVEAPLTTQLELLWQHVKDGHGISQRALLPDELSRLGLQENSESLLPHGFRKPSWMSDDELREWLKRTGEMS